MKNGEIIELYETLERLTQNKELKFNVVAGYILTKNKATLRHEADIIYKMRRDILLEYGKVDGQDITVPREKVEEVNQKISELMNIENDIQLRQLTIDLLEGTQLNLEDMEQLSRIIYPFAITSPPIIEKDG